MSPDELVRGLANKSVVTGAVGLLCCGLILGPLSLSYANRAEAAMLSNDAGREHAGMIKMGRILGYTAVGFWILASIIRIAGVMND